MPQNTPPDDPKKIFLHNFWSRYYRALDYLTLFIYSLVVSSAAFLVDYFLVFIVKLVVTSAVSQYPQVSIMFDWFQIGSAALALVVAFIFSFFSAFSQVRFAYDTSREPILSDNKDEK